MRYEKVIVCSMAMALLFSVAADAANQPGSQVMVPGLWEVTIKTELGSVTPTTTTQMCISKEQAERLEPKKSKPAEDCQTSGALTGSLLKYKVTCGRKHATYDAEFTYSGDHYEGVINIKSDELEVRQVYTARRLGNCPPPPEE